MNERRRQNQVSDARKKRVTKQSTRDIQSLARQKEKHPHWKDIDIERFQELYDSGLYISEISKILNVDRQILDRRIKLYSLVRKSI